ncbi:hypothetical protein BpHYR1_044814 [Brachionus plicatilis]|uniref:Uncharacterized protein n=1 Tax=Brachionus plicatilis TaxID=10195 RepID=A0A3M7QHT6_BRAPC|nr:hypothetical protein BpHYR1_044814 [Brachionus plicatilis]
MMKMHAIKKCLDEALQKIFSLQLIGSIFNLNARIASSTARLFKSLNLLKLLIDIVFPLMSIIRETFRSGVITNF